MEENDRENPSSSWPAIDRGGVVSLGLNEFRDERGIIRNLAEHSVGSVAVIESRGNTERSNHWHRTDAHYLFTLQGRWLYQECEPDQDVKNAPPVEVKSGETVYTPPKRLHRCVFLEDTTLISMSKLTRTHAEHEADVVRVE